MEPNEVLDRLVEIDVVCQNLSSTDKLGLLSIAYLITASHVRSEALIAPGKFQVEREKQVADLETMAAMIREDTPDLELERLQLENDIPSILRHLTERRDELKRELPPDE